jgi:integrase
MAKKVHIRALKSGILYYDFFYKGVRCKEYTTLLDTPQHRTRLEKEAKIIAVEIELEKFDYLRHFPNGSRKHLFIGRPDGDISFQRYATEVWLPHMQTKLRESTLRDYESILVVSVFPLIGDLKLKDIRPEHIDQLTNMLRKREGIKAKTLSPRRMNIILIRVRQVLDLAHEREYIDKNPHGWIHLQQERRPPIDPLSFEEKEHFLSHLPEPAHGFRKHCPDFWQRYFIVAFDTGLRPSEQLALGWEHIDFTHKKILVRRGLVRGVETDLKTLASAREIDMLPTVEEVLRSQPRDEYVFPNADGGPLDLTNMRVRVWFPTLQRASLKPRNLYQTRHTFASLMLQSGEDPA